MIRLIAVAGFAVAAATSVQAMTPAPMAQPESVIVQVREGCGPGMVLMNGTCVARSTIRQERRDYTGTRGYLGYGGYYGPGESLGNRGYQGNSGYGGYDSNGCYQTRNSYGRTVTTCP